MEIPGAGKSPNTSLSFRYNANNEELEELYSVCEEEPLMPLCDTNSPSIQTENASPKKPDKTSSILEKYFKSAKAENIKPEDIKGDSVKVIEEFGSTPSKEVSSSPVKDYLNRLSKKNTCTDVSSEPKEGNETWKIFHDFKYKITQAVVDMKARSSEEIKEKSVPRENSVSDSEENSARDSVKDSDQSIGDTDNQVSSLESSIQNLSEISQPITAKADCETSVIDDKNQSEATDNTHKNIESKQTDVQKEDLDDSLEVESGVEAFEDTNMNVEDSVDGRDTPIKSCTEGLPFNTAPCITCPEPKYTELKKKKTPTRDKVALLTFFTCFFTIIVFLSCTVFPSYYAWNGFLFGIWLFYFVGEFSKWFMDNYLVEDDSERLVRILNMRRKRIVPIAYTVPAVLEHKPAKKYDGWINHYRFPEYDPYYYNVGKTTTAFMKLEGSILRISYTQTKVAKRALWDEQLDKATFYQHRLYNLTGARCILLPKGLVRKRQWSKKYPICIVLNENEKIEVLEKEGASERKDAQEKKKEGTPEVETAETNTSPEKKKKFVWRKRDKSISHPESEAGREGLRHRLARKMHRDKKTESVATSTEYESQHGGKSDTSSVDNDPSSTKSQTSTKADELDLETIDILRIRELLDDADLDEDGAGEGEWSVHVKESKDNHSHLYLFGRTGREKHEWFRRISLAIEESTAASTDSSLTEDRTNTEAAADKDPSATYKVSDREVSLYNKNPSKPEPSVEPAPMSLPNPLSDTISDFSTYNKTFWPFFFKIIQTHTMPLKQTAEKGILCQLDPTVQERNKTRKRKKSDAKAPCPPCQCAGVLPTEVSWVNSVIARIVYDVMRDPKLIAQVQNRIQRKLNTMKLPSFMSPLLVTDLSLSGACPLLERISPPTWDERGVWLDADLKYDGGAYISVLTQINLMKLKKKNLTLEEQLLHTTEHVVEEDSKTTRRGSVFSEKQLRERKPAIFNEDIEDSPESSSDEEDAQQIQPVDSSESTIALDTQTTTIADNGMSKKKLLRMVDKIATNKYFQTVTDYKVVKRAMEGISNTDIKLYIEVQCLEGRLTVNLPSPPHDRIWLGFRTNPLLILKARPAFGARTLRFAHVSNWIEQKLTREFEKFLVLPNMEDFTIDIMTPTPAEYE